jgi:GNAT superfamily N-acetyltransferase
MTDDAPITVTRGGFRITTDRRALDLAAVHAALARQYWAEGISRERLERSVQHSLCFGLFHGAEQVGFARVVTDYCAIAYLNDVYVLEPFRGQGHAVWLMETILAHPGLQGLKRICLATRDAHGLYTRFGFKPLRQPERWMEIFDPAAYKKG